MIIQKTLACAVAAATADAKDREPLLPHAGKVLRITVGPAALGLRVKPDGSLQPVHPGVSADAAIVVPLLPASGEAVQASGDSELLEAAAGLRSRLASVCEERVERAFGPLAGSAATNLRLGLRRTGADARVRLGEAVAAWLTKESGLLPEPGASRELAAQTDEFARRVEAIRQRVTAHR